MADLHTDILVSGGGVAGLVATARLAAAGLDCVCVDPAPADTPGDDLRSTAFLQPAVETLRQAGAWDRLAPEAAALWTMRMVDAGGPNPVVRERCDFNSHDIQDAPFGYNLPNRAVRQALIATIADAPKARLRDRRSVSAVTRREREAVVRLSDGTTVHARLVVAADGRDSPVREAAGIGARRWHYAQRALVLTVAHEIPHQGISTEILRTGGPLTLVPIPDRDGRAMSAVVWMTDAAEALALDALPDPALSAEITARTLGLYGPVEIVGPRALWPIIGQMAERMTAQRLALIAEAAHVVPPIGAQGLNMSLADIETLTGLVATAAHKGEDIAAPGLLGRYERARMPEVLARVGGVHVLNRFSQTEIQPLRDLRRVGLAAIHRLSPIRRLAMRLGMGGGASTSSR